MKTIIYEKEKPIKRVIKKGYPTEKPDLKRLKESSDFALKHDSIRERVISILRSDKFSRRNDLWLLLLYYHKMGYLKLKIDISQFNKIHMPESISRARRSIYQDIRENKLPQLRFLLDDQETLNIREKEEEKYREYFGGKIAYKKRCSS